MYAAAVAATLAQSGHTVEIFTADPTTAHNPPTITHSDGVRIHQLPVRATGKDDLAGRIGDVSEALASHSVYASCEAAWAHYWISGAVALAANESLAAPPPLAVSFHTIAAVKERDTPGHIESAARLRNERDIAARADVLVANTQSEAHDITTFLRAPSSRVLVARPGVDLAVYTPGSKAAARQAIGRADADLMVLGVGRMQFVKGTDIAIDAIARLQASDPHLARRVELDFLGAGSGGPSTDAFLELAEAAGIREQLTIRPPVPARELANWYRAADVVIVPSRSESFGFAAAEAQASGACVLASAVGGLNTVIDDGTTGVLVYETDSTQWARELGDLLRDPDRRDALGAAGHRAAQRYVWDECTITVLNALLSSAGTRRAGRTIAS